MKVINFNGAQYGEYFTSASPLEDENASLEPCELYYNLLEARRVQNALRR